MIQVAVIAGLSAGWLVAGALSAMVPVAIHLWARRRAAVVSFPAARFVQAILAGQARRRRLRDAMLLALRIVALLALAAGFARPVWESSNAGAADHGAALVIILDASASMRRAAGGLHLFEDARRQAIAALERLDPARDVASLILIDDETEPVLPLLSANIPALIEAARAASCTLERGNAASAMRKAEVMLRSDTVDGRERAILILSDMQATQWHGVTTSGDGISISVAPPGSRADSTNLAVTDAVVSPARPVAGRGSVIRATVRNHSDEPRAVVVRFRAGGQEVGDALADVPAWSEREVEIVASFESPGPIGIEATIPGDAFEWDDSARSGIRVAGTFRSAILTMDRATGDPSSSAWYLRAAMEASSGAPPEVLSAETADDPPLIGFDAVAVVRAGRLTNPAARALVAFAEQGGIVLWMIDSAEAADSVRDMRAWSAAAPLELGRWIGDDAPKVRARPSLGAAVGSGGDLAAALRAWDGAPVAGVVESALRQGASALLESDAGPLAARASIGGGVIVMLTMDLDPQRSRAVRAALLPMFIHGLMTDEASGTFSGEREFVGRTIHTTADGSFSADLTDSLGRAARTLRTDAETIGIALDPIPEPATLIVSDREGKVASVVGVNLDPAEGDPRALSPEQIRAMTKSPATASIVQPVIRADARRVDLWAWLIGAALLILVGEGWLRQRVKRGALA